MTRFVEDEIRPLVTLCIGPDLAAVGSTRRLARKIMSNDPRDRMEALRETLKLETDDYQEGIFCWKGFLYYKWLLTSLTIEVATVVEAVQTIRPIGKVDQDARDSLDRSRAVLRDRIAQTCREVERTIGIYDAAYAGLTLAGQPVAFRDFLLEAPRLFTRLGDQLGAIQHVVSFWRYRFSPGASGVGAEELMDIFTDFENGLAERKTGAGSLLMAA